MGHFPKAGYPEAAALVVGSEILGGRTQDTNTLLLIGTLMRRGVRLRRWTVVPDHGPSIISELTRLVLEGFDLIFVSGGMGPTHDDVTVASVAEALSLSLVQDAGSAARMEERWRRLNPGKGLPEASREGLRKMSAVPEGFRTVPNEAGMAEGLWGRVGGRGALLVVLPGVPVEYKALLLSKELDSLLPRGGEILVEEVEFEGRESQLAKTLRELQDGNPDVEVGSYPQGPLKVTVRLTGPAHRVRDLKCVLQAGLDRIKGSA